MEQSVDLTKFAYVTSGGRVLSLQELVDHWDWHVARFAKDLADDVDDDHARGAHDFFAALYVRQRLAGGSAEAIAEIREVLAERSAETRFGRVDPGLGFAGPPEMNPLTKEGTLQEPQLVEVRFDALRSTVDLQFDLRMVLKMRHGAADDVKFKW